MSEAGGIEASNALPKYRNQQSNIYGGASIRATHAQYHVHNTLSAS